ncbi:MULTISPECIES: hypothetical protein [Rhizobium]|uniref:Uncharacterized protein n=1 Tax=Rhizobium tropici TaxID=398 RepID=A0A6P1C9A2_RHITR|nr:MULTISPECIES: hypothetical protein [Rhizobium]AGB70412.1 hypothetical protein RTCIAT899_CH05020 [Rhizobium tropici CIAT 899]MBB4241359.1 hypothetical protein [Rhizobium tropici]MBB5592901.1 hypothetical protein [Rhizobium tropici]MBB6491943.1 hypothetical protein [Rhizobium tropici]NEV13760.1 hypothetical protein [Rhizobium tropici]
MSILKLFFNHLLEEDREQEGDPLQHPMLASMSLEELADLPLMPENLGRPLDKRYVQPEECA